MSSSQSESSVTTGWLVQPIPKMSKKKSQFGIVWIIIPSMVEPQDVLSASWSALVLENPLVKAITDQGAWCSLANVAASSLRMAGALS